MNPRWVTEQLHDNSLHLVSSPQLLDRDGHRTTWRIEEQSQRYFLKVSTQMEALEAELKGIKLMGQTKKIRVPEVFLSNTADRAMYALFEWLDLKPGSIRCHQRLGENLANLHRCQGKSFGLDSDNFIGASPQPNTETEDWFSFFRDYRLGAQLKMAKQNGLDSHLLSSAQAISDNISSFFHQPVVPSLLHGDLWAGNWGSLQDDEPVVFDPACYFGDREADLAMTELFGGFSEAFYSSYNEVWPLPEGYSVRKDLYNLYHMLNHFNLFGQGYIAQVSSLISKLQRFI